MYSTYQSYINQEDTYQGVPKFGYTEMFKEMLNHPNIHPLLSTDYKDVVKIDMTSGEIRLFGKRTTIPAVATICVAPLPLAKSTPNG